MPERVGQFIREIESLGTAKICGAGSVAGSGGVVMVLADECAYGVVQQYGYTVSPHEGSARRDCVV